MTPVAPQDTLSELLQSTVAPAAAQLDSDPTALKKVFELLGQHHLLGLRVPKDWGGQAWDGREVHRFVERLSRYSGALAFLQIQHQSAVRELSQSQNQALKRQYLRDAVSGHLGIGIGYSHLRRTQQPITVDATASGYTFNGTVPWITGFGIFQYWLLAAKLPDGRAVFALVPFHTVMEAERRLSFSAPFEMAAMESTQTVAATLESWFVPEELVLDVKPAEWIQEKDLANPFGHGFFALGCARAGLDILERAKTTDFPAIAKTYDALNAKLTHCRDRTYAALSAGSVQEQLTLRGQAIELAVQCAHAGVIVSRGAANLKTHPAQRVYREALAFTVFGQTSDVMASSLSLLGAE